VKQQIGNQNRFDKAGGHVATIAIVQATAAFAIEFR
jgi:hypothetical protein